MPQLVKGGKWVFGWVVVGANRTLPLPPEAAAEYGFEAGDAVVLTPGSRRSGDFGVSTPTRLATSKVPLRTLGQSKIDADGQVILPPEIQAQPDDRLLAVRGSGTALGFIKHGPIYQEALAHPELLIFE